MLHVSLCINHGNSFLSASASGVQRGGDKNAMHGVLTAKRLGVSLCVSTSDTLRVCALQC